MTRLAHLKVLSCVLLLCWSGVVSAENWTRFRGPNGSGHAGDIHFPATWTEDDYAWRKTLPGVGHSSPVGWKNYLYITSGDVESGNVTLYCLAADTGKELWNREFTGQQHRMHAANSYASTTPTVDGKHVYFAWATAGKMHCVALTHQGEQQWRTELGEFTGPHGFAASPIVVSGTVCMQVDHGEEGFLAGIDAASGDLRWQAVRSGGKASYSTPCVMRSEEGYASVISQSMTGGMQAMDVNTGDVVWELTDAFPARTVSSPFLLGDTIIGVCGGGGNGKKLVGVQLDKSSQPVEKLLLRKQIPYVPTPLVKDSLLFLWHDQGKISCSDLKSERPQKMLWTERIGGKFFGSPILAGNKIYCISMEGKAVVIAADKEFKLLGENDLGEPSNATPAVHEGRLYLRTESTLACLEQVGS